MLIDTQKKVRLKIYALSGNGLMGYDMTNLPHTCANEKLNDGHLIETWKPAPVHNLYKQLWFGVLI